MGEGERPLLDVVLVRGDEAERRRRDLDFSVGSGEDTEGLRRRLGVLDRVSGEEEAERLLREGRAFLVSSGDREPRRRGGVRDLVLVGSGEDLEPLRVALVLGGCSGEDSELLLPSGEGPLSLPEEADLLRLGRARGTGAWGSGEESEALCALAATLATSFTSGEEADLLRREGRAFSSTSGEDPERLLCLSGALGSAFESGEDSDSLLSCGDVLGFPSSS